jgi:hypothetical protein
MSKNESRVHKTQKKQTGIALHTTYYILLSNHLVKDGRVHHTNGNGFSNYCFWISHQVNGVDGVEQLLLPECVSTQYTISTGYFFLAVDRQQVGRRRYGGGGWVIVCFSILWRNFYSDGGGGYGGYLLDN